MIYLHSKNRKSHLSWWIREGVLIEHVRKQAALMRDPGSEAVTMRLKHPRVMRGKRRVCVSKKAGKADSFEWPGYYSAFSEGMVGNVN